MGGELVTTTGTTGTTGFSPVVVAQNKNCQSFANDHQSDLSAQLHSEAPGVVAGKYAVLAWLEENPMAAAYIRRLHGDDHHAGARCLYRVFKWLTRRPGWQPPVNVSEVEWILDKQGSCRTDRARAVLEEMLIDFCNSEVHGTHNYKLKFYNTFHGLCKRHHIQLPNTDVEEIRADTAAVEGTLTLTDVFRIISTCKLRERAVFTLMWQSLMDSERFIQFNKNGWSRLEPQIRNENDWLIYKIPYRKKNDKPYFVMWHRTWDGPKLLLEYIEDRGTPRRVGTDERGQPVYEPIFLNRQGGPFNKDNLKHAWIQAATRAGVVERIHPYCKICGAGMVKTRRYVNGASKKRYECRCGNIQQAREFYRAFSHTRYGKNLHEIRDVLSTNLPTLAGVRETHVNFFAGHKIDPLDYQKLRDADKNPQLMDGLQQDWIKAEPFLNMWSHGGITIESTAKQRAMEEDLRRAEAKIERQGREIEELRAFFEKDKLARIQTH